MLTADLLKKNNFGCTKLVNHCSGALGCKRLKGSDVQRYHSVYKHHQVARVQRKEYFTGSQGQGGREKEPKLTSGMLNECSDQLVCRIFIAKMSDDEGDAFCIDE